MWITKDYEKYGKPRIAETDIETFKVCRMNENNQAVPFEADKASTVYERGLVLNHHKAVGVRKTDNSGTISDGIYSYSIDTPDTRPSRLSPCTIVKFIDTVFGKDFLSMSYSRKTHKDAKQAALVYCTIPAGSLYYQNERGEVMSNILRIDKVKKF